jgi:type I restriction enzyme S subunit
MHSYQLTIDNNQLPDGYKQTEVGVISEEWNALSLGDIVEIIDGDRGTNYPSDSDFYPDGYCLFLSARNVTKEGFSLLECSFISEHKDNLLRKGKLSRWDIVLTTRGTVGNIAFFDESIPYKAVRINSGMVLLRNLDDSLSSNFLYATLRSGIVQRQIQKTVFGSAQPQLTVKGISAFLIPIPPTKQEQQAIARALSDVDALIAALDKLIAKKRDIATATMQQLLTGARRLPGFGQGMGYKQTEVGVIPENWDLITLANVVVNGQLPSGIYKEKSLYGTGNKIIKLGDVFSLDYFEPRNAQRVSLTDEDLTRYRVDVGDIFVALASVKLEGVGKVMLVTSLDEPTAYDHNVALIRASDCIDYVYLFYFLKSDLIRNEVSKSATQVGTTFLKASTILSFPFLSPSLAEQQAIAQVLSDMDAEIAALEARRDKTKAVKQGMMQELLTGRIRLV